MALRAGYYGIKKSLLDTITGLVGSKVIKSIGNGLALTDAGELSTDIDTNTMEYLNGKLAAKSVNWDFATENAVPTGQKWIDGKELYCRVVVFDNPVSVPAYTSGTAGTQKIACPDADVLDKVPICLPIGYNWQVIPLGLNVGVNSDGDLYASNYFSNTTMTLNAFIYFFTKTTPVVSNTKKSKKTTAKADTEKEGE